MAPFLRSLELAATVELGATAELWVMAFPSRLAPMVPKEIHQLVIDEFEGLIRELQEDAASIAG